MNQVAPFAEVEHQRAVLADGLVLDCGVTIRPLTVAYRTYGTLNAARSNAIMVCHALTGDQYVAETQPLTGKEGWWDAMIGPGKPVDTDRFFVICTNVLGGCMGSTGPREEMTDEEGGPQGRPWGTDFPVVTIRDMVRAQKKLTDHLGITRLLAVIGGSMGGMQVLEWAATYPEAVFAAAPIAAATHHSAQNIAFHEVGRAAIHSDPDWRSGRYWEDGRIPAQGLSVARMVAHITYLSEAALTRKFGRRLQGARAAIHLDDAGKPILRQRIAPGDEPLVHGGLGGLEGSDIRARLAHGPRGGAKPAAFKGVHIKQVHDQDVVQRGADGGEKARARCGEPGLAQSRAGVEQPVIGPGIVARLRAHQQRAAHIPSAWAAPARKPPSAR